MSDLFDKVWPGWKPRRFELYFTGTRQLAKARAQGHCEREGCEFQVEPVRVWGGETQYPGLEAHHKVKPPPEVYNLRSAYHTLGNLIVLCRPCHEREHHPLKEKTKSITQATFQCLQPALFQWSPVIRGG